MVSCTLPCIGSRVHNRLCLKRNMRDCAKRCTGLDLNLILEVRGSNILLLTNCEVHVAKYLDRSFEIRSRNLSREYFSCNSSVRALSYSYHELIEKFSELFMKIFGKLIRHLFKSHICENQTVTLPQKFDKFLGDLR